MLAGYEAVYGKITEYLGTGSIVLLFVCALCFLALFTEQTKTRKVYLWYALFLMLGALNPVTVAVLAKLGHLDVLERFFWLLLSPVILSAAGAVLGKKRPALTIAALVLILLCGKSVFTHIEFKSAENSLKISSEAVEVSDLILRDFEGLGEDAKIVPNRGLADGKRPRAAVTEPLSEDIRMYNADLDLWLVRSDFGSAVATRYKRLAGLLTQSNSEIPIRKVLRHMRKQKFTYLVLGDWQEITGTAPGSFSQIGQTAHYRVYKYMPVNKTVVRRFPDPEGYQCMSYLLQDYDGTTIVVDGGRAWQSLSLTEQIEKAGGKVDAWIITHPHDDHCGVLASILEAEWDKDKIKIDRIYMGEWDFDAVNAQGLRTDTVYYLMENLKKRDNVTYLKTGDELQIGSLTMKVLHTCNRTVTENSDNILNDGSLVFKLSGKKRSMLFLGDIADNNADMADREGLSDEQIGRGSKMGCLLADEILSQFPEDVKSTYVQMAHHGNCRLPDYFYEAVAPRAAVFDAPEWLMENKNKETGEESYYTNPHYRKLMEGLGAKILSFSDNKKLRLY